MSSQRNFVDLSPYVLGVEVGEGAAAVQVPEVRYVGFRPAPPTVPTGPGYLVVHRGDPVAGDEVLVGSMPDGLAGGVAEWTSAVLTSVDGETGPAEGRG